MAKVEVVSRFVDCETGARRQVGEELDLSEERVDRLVYKNCVKRKAGRPPSGSRKASTQRETAPAAPSASEVDQ